MLIADSIVFILLKVATLKDQLKQEIQKRQLYISRSVRTGDEIRDIRHILDNSLSNVTRDTSLDPILLEHEAKKLDNSLDMMHKGVSPPVKLSPVRNTSPVRSSIRGRGVTSSTSLRRNVISPAAYRHKIKK